MPKKKKKTHTHCQRESLRLTMRKLTYDRHPHTDGHGPGHAQTGTHTHTFRQQSSKILLNLYVVNYKLEFFRASALISHHFVVPFAMACWHKNISFSRTLDTLEQLHNGRMETCAIRHTHTPPHQPIASESGADLLD